MKQITNQTSPPNILNHNQKILIYIESFFATWAIMRIGNLHSMNIIAFSFFLLCVICFSAMEKEFTLQASNNRKKQKMIAGISSGIFQFS